MDFFIVPKTRHRFDWLSSFTGFHRVWRVRLGFTGFHEDLLVLTRFLPSFTGFYLFLLGSTGFYLVLPGFTGFYWVLLGFTGSY